MENPTQVFYSVPQPQAFFYLHSSFTNRKEYSTIGASVVHKAPGIVPPTGKSFKNKFSRIRLRKSSRNGRLIELIEEEDHSASSISIVVAE